MQRGRVMEGMWDRRSLQTAVLGPPAGGDARQIVFCAVHVDRRQLEMCTRDERKTKNEEGIDKKAAASRAIRFSFFGLR